MNGKWIIFTVSSDTRRIKFHARWKSAEYAAWRLICSVTLSLCLPCSHPFPLPPSPFSFHLTPPTQSQSLFLRVLPPVQFLCKFQSELLYISCLPLSFLTGLSQVLQVKTLYSCSCFPLLLVLSSQVGPHPV